ncbi:hypothetical protein WN51_12557 [Melipona quadrifasciata]|uniref:Uncharacterized protein n=1 Tax=Melipona quadrifasciata TaxID=166423 RepID=A0A0M9A4N3_9HYME|nr:hypothetical protein WN51_12557 [Melipona quadrifasciata]
MLVSLLKQKKKRKKKIKSALWNFGKTTRFRHFDFTSTFLKIYLSGINRRLTKEPSNEQVQNHS